MKSRLLFSLPALIALMCLISMNKLIAQPYYAIDSIVITPENPTHFDQISIQFYGTASDSCSVLDTLDYGINGFDFDLYMDWDTSQIILCDTNAIQWDTTFFFQNLPAGSYAINLLGNNYADSTGQTLGFQVSGDSGPCGSNPIIWVTSAADDGPGTLREAIECANSTAAADIIYFNIPGLGSHIINVGDMTGDSLPPLTDNGTYIDATTQPGHGMNGDYSPRIMLNGSANNWTKPINGLEIKASNISVYGLGIRAFPYNGIYVESAFGITIGAYQKGNFIFENGAFQDAYLNYEGTYEGSGIHFKESTNSLIQGNSIGSGGGNEYAGILIEGSNNTFTIGGNSVNDGNLIAYNLEGVTIEEGIDYALIKSNQFICNNTTGINFIGTVNDNIQPPVIDLVTSTMIQGTATDGDVDVYLNIGSGCSDAPCQGATYIGTAMATGGVWTLEAPFEHNDTIASGDQIVTQLIDASSNSSEFSLCEIGSGLSACTDSIGQIWVTNTNENGPGSLADAMICADTTVGSNVIKFDIPGTGPHTIFVGQTTGLSLQAITDEGTVVDGTSQPGYGVSGNFTPQIILDGGATWNVPYEAFLIQANFCRITAIEIVNFPNDAIKIDGATNCMINDNVIYNNGDVADEFPGLPGQGPFEGSGIVIADGARDNLIYNNYIGTNYTETINGGNEFCGVLVEENCIFNSIGNTGMGNVIANNLEGIRVLYVSSAVRISQNSIYCNTDAAIELVIGQANQVVVPAPDFSLANFTSTTFISGTIEAFSSTLPTPLLGASIELFLNDDTGCANAPCQGKTYLGSSELIGGDWQVSAPFANGIDLENGDLVTAVFIDANGNTSAFSECYIVADCMLSVNPSVVNETCGDDNGMITFVTTGGPSPYTYDMGMGPQSSNVFSGLNEGSYTVTVTDGYNCTVISSATLTDSPIPTVSVSNVENEICDLGNGSFIASADGGTAPYSYTIGGVTGPNFTGLTTGQYVVTVSDLYGCSDTDSVSIGFTEGPDLQIDELNPETCEAFNGEVIFSSEGGTPLYFYSLGSSSQTNPSFSSLTAGEYVGTVTDDNGCVDTMSFEILSAPGPSDATTTNVNGANCGNADGSFSVVVTGGSDPLFYDIGDGGQSNTSFSGLAAGSYVVTVSDVNFCTITTSVTIADLAGPDLEVSNLQDANCGQSTGSITVSASNGTGAYSYDIGNGGQVSAIFNGLVAGGYTVTVTDGIGCTSEVSATVNDIGGPSVSVSNQNDETCETSNGSITVFASGGTSPYFYDIGNGITSNPSFNNLAEGIYNITVTDATNCDAIIQATLANVGALPVSGFSYTELDGTVTLTNTSSASSTSFQWSFGDGNTSTDMNPVHAYANSGTYNLCLQANSDCGFDVFCESVTIAPSIVVISGRIEKETGQAVQNVEMNCTGQSAIINNADGTYSFDMVPAGGDYEVTGLKDTLYGNGVSTFDVFLIQQHVLNIDTLDSPYKIIAADVDAGGFVSTFDAFRMQQVILANVDTFPNNTSWRFVAKDYNFIDPMNPLPEDFWESLTYTNIMADTINQDLIAIKVGDVTLNANPAFAPGTDNVYELLLNDQYLVSGETVEVNVTAKDAKVLSAMQFDLNFDPSVLEFLAVETADVAGINEYAFGQRNVADGVLKFAWYDGSGSGQQIDANTVLFKLIFKSKKAGVQLSEYLSIAPFNSGNVAFELDGLASNVVTVFGMTTSAGEPTTGYDLQSQPNPFTTSTTLQVTLPKGERGMIKVYDISGKVAFQKEVLFHRGVNNFTIQSNDLPSKGLYYIHIATDGFSQTGKIVLQ